MSDFRLPDESRIKLLFEHSDYLVRRSDVVIARMWDTTNLLRNAEHGEKYFSTTQEEPQLGADDQSKS